MKDQINQYCACHYYTSQLVALKIFFSLLIQVSMMNIAVHVGIEVHFQIPRSHSREDL